MGLVVKDACLLIDLAEADLLGFWVKTGEETHVTDFVLNEIKRAKQWKQISAFVDAGSLKKHSLAPGDLSDVATFSRENKVSLPDASSAFLAKRLGARLLTGDMRLRRAAINNEIETHGTLWVFDFLVEKKILAPHDAGKRLEKLRAGGSRFPEDEYRRRIVHWFGKTGK